MSGERGCKWGEGALCRVLVLDDGSRSGKGFGVTQLHSPHLTVLLGVPRSLMCLTTCPSVIPTPTHTHTHHNHRWLSLLNCFSGGVFLAAGLVHLLPHCQESQERIAHLVGDYPLYLVLITLGYMLVLFVERVLFDVHGSSHGHGPHTGGRGFVGWLGGWVGTCGGMLGIAGVGTGSVVCACAAEEQMAARCLMTVVVPPASHTCLASVLLLLLLCCAGRCPTGIAPPCVDCITAETVVEQQVTFFDEDGDEGGADRLLPDTPSSPPPPTTNISSQVLVPSAAVTPRAAGRYNLRSRTGGSGGSHTPSLEGGHGALTKPLLADSSGEANGGAHHHHHHGGGSHSHSHAHSGGGGSGHGGHASHVPHHHHGPVVTGDLKQGVVLLVAMSVHTFLECMALGLMVSRQLRRCGLCWWDALHSLLAGGGGVLLTQAIVWTRTGDVWVEWTALRSWRLNHFCLHSAPVPPRPTHYIIACPPAAHPQHTNTIINNQQQQDMRKEFLMLFMAIASHKLISGLALSSRFLKEGATTRQVGGWGRCWRSMVAACVVVR